MSIVQTTIYLKTVLEQWQQEIVRRKQLEEELRATQERFQDLISSNPAIIYSCHPDENYPINFVSENSKEILGYTTQEWLATPKFWVNRIHPEDAPRIVANLSVLFKEGYHTHEYRFLHQDGTYRWLRDERKLVRDTAGNPVEMIGYIVDITERKRVERIKDKFIAIASHELRTPLTSLQGSLGLLTTGRLGNLTEQGQKLLEFALLDTERLVRLVNDILDLKRLKLGNNVLNPSRFQTDELIEQVRHVMQPIADDAGVMLSIATTSKPLWANPDLIIQVLTNLLSNAIKFSPSGSTVWLNAEPQFFCGGGREIGRWREAGDKEKQKTFPKNQQPTTNNQQQFPTILFQVRDQGRGIPSDQLETIFEPFRQVDVSDSHQKEGTGLGLAICRSIVQQHGGRIWVESTLGVGSTFYFTLTMSPEHLTG
ncbi:MAG: PAS domain-containing protein [Symploca sp. SIO1C2]|nr:PAS domain-containing protein [Symploca sp. SIO1C2]